MSFSAATRVLSSKKKLSLEGARLTVKEVAKPDCGRADSFKGPIRKDAIYIHGLTDNISQDSLELKLEEAAQDATVREVMYGIRPGTALIMFEETIGR